MGIISSVLEDNPNNFNKIDLMTPKMFADYSKKGFYAFAEEVIIIYGVCFHCKNELLVGTYCFRCMRRNS